jgi:zinc D-Ala-D-Ala carboxypeptidase
MTRTTTASSARIRGRRILVAAVVIAALAASFVLVSFVAVPVTAAIATALGSPGDGGSTPGATDAGGEGSQGVVLGGVTVFDDVPAVSRLNPDLLRALREAADDAAREDIRFEVNSGWRSPEYQDQLLQDAVAQYGSLEEAARWVASSRTSAHVSGDAVDIGGFDATLWLGENGPAYGLCQIYDNEPWHFELRPEAPEQGCPDEYWDPTYDPRMQG